MRSIPHSRSPISDWAGGKIGERCWKLFRDENLQIFFPKWANEFAPHDPVPVPFRRGMSHLHEEGSLSSHPPSQ